jgi:hypothetical protein
MKVNLVTMLNVRARLRAVLSDSEARSTGAKPPF